jgi:amino acid transporter
LATGTFTFSVLANVNTTRQLAVFGFDATPSPGCSGPFLTLTALTSAEMGSTFPETGGIYH